MQAGTVMPQALLRGDIIAVSTVSLLTYRSER